MRFKLLIVACFAAALSVYAAAPSFTHRATAQQKLPGKMDIPSVDEKWGKVVFDHQQHLPFSDCIYCHHTTKGLTLDAFNAGKSEKVQLCADCHARKEGDAKTPKNKDGEELWSKLAYHENCIDCHKGEIKKIPKDVGMAAIKKQGEGPTKCADCHEKKD